MYDMISNDSYLLKPQPIGEKVYYSLHWSIQKLFKIAFKKLQNLQITIFLEIKFLMKKEYI